MGLRGETVPGLEELDEVEGGREAKPEAKVLKHCSLQRDEVVHADAL